MLVHQLLTMRAIVRDPPKDPELIKTWLLNLVEAINMKVLMGPYSIYSEMENNRGLTAMCIIETSHIAIHCWDETDPAEIHLDVFSCAPINPRTVFEALEEFNPVHVDYKFMDRINNFKEIEHE